MRRLWAALRGVDGEVWLLLALSVFAWAPLTAPGYFLKAHDAPHTLFFLNAFDQTLRDGYAIPRWGTDFALGYGYPLFLFLSPLAYYVAEAFHLLGAGLTAAVKLTFALSFVLSGLTMYLLGRRLLGRSAGLVAGALYLYVPYHLVDVYVRGDLAESFAYIFMPLCLWTFTRLLERRNGRDLAWAGLSYAGLLLAHNGTALLFTPVLMAWVLCLLARLQHVATGRAVAYSSVASPLVGVRGTGTRPDATGSGQTPTRGDATPNERTPAAAPSERPRASALVGVLSGALWAIGAAALAAGLSAFFLLPAFAERGFIVEQQWVQGSFNYLKQFVYPAQFLAPFWGFGYAGEGLADQMPFQLGLIPILLALVGALWARPAGGRRAALIFFSVVTLAAIFLMTPASTFLWQMIPLAALVQFPWRLLLITSVSLALLGGGAALTLGEAGRRPAALLALVVALGSFAYTLPQYTEPAPRSEETVAVIEFELVYPPDRTGMMAWTQEQPMTTPLVAQYLAGQPLTKAHVLAGEATVRMARHGGSSDEIVAQAQTPATIEFYTYYFPGWQARLDGQAVPIRPSGKFGLIALDIPAGEHRISLRFRDTPIRVAGEILSALSLAALAGLFWRGRPRPTLRNDSLGGGTCG